MQNVMLGVIALVWLGGSWVRVYRQARYFQIEEYMNVRYLRWWLARRERWLLTRPLIVAALGVVLAVLMAESPGSALPGFVGALAALIAVWPPPLGEIKKPFRRTARATRLLIASFGVATFDIGLYLFLFSLLGLQNYEFKVAAVMAAGLLVHLTVPLILISGNILMIPVESLMRRRFIASARHVLAEIRPTVIGITGSYGKTTTKHFITDILNGRFRAYATPKSYNTMMGVCLAINNDLKNDYSIDYFVVEMGAYIRGEIARICDLTPPHISVVVDVGPQHLERFGTLENTAAAKYEIIKALPPDGVGVFNWDSEHVRAMYERGYPNTRLAVSRSVALDAVPPGGPRFVASDIEQSLDGLRFTVTDIQTGAQEVFAAPVPGEHNVTNILLATAIAVHEGMSLRDVAQRVKSLRPAESRLVRHTTPQGITIINDAYSANPTGVISALKVLSLHDTGRRLVVTPGMVELGPLQDEENRKLGHLIYQHATDVILVGAEQSHSVKIGLDEAGFPADRLHVVNELREAMAWYQTNLQQGDTVLFLNDLPDTY